MLYAHAIQHGVDGEGVFLTDLSQPLFLLCEHDDPLRIVFGRDELHRHAPTLVSQRPSAPLVHNQHSSLVRNLRRLGGVENAPRFFGVDPPVAPVGQQRAAPNNIFDTCPHGVCAQYLRLTLRPVLRRARPDRPLGRERVPQAASFSVYTSPREDGGAS